MSKLTELIKAGNRVSWRYAYGPSIMYRYAPEELQAIIDEACKEQRHNCQIERTANYTIQDEEDRWYISLDDIINAQKPETGI